MSTHVAMPSVWSISKRWRRFFDSASTFAFFATESVLDVAPGSAPKKLKSNPADLLLDAGADPKSGNLPEGTTGVASAGRLSIGADSFSVGAGFCARAARGTSKAPRANNQGTEMRVIADAQISSLRRECNDRRS